MKLYILKNNIYRVNNNTLEYTDSSMENDFTPVEYFNDFTVGDLLELIDNLGQFNISNSIRQKSSFHMNIELSFDLTKHGVYGQK